MIRGAPWAGENRVDTVEVSTNVGKDWNVANLNQESQPYVWVLWHYPWDVKATVPTQSWCALLTVRALLSEAAEIHKDLTVY